MRKAAPSLQTRMATPKARTFSLQAGVRGCPDRFTSCSGREIVYEQIDANNPGAVIGRYRVSVSLAVASDVKALQNTLFIYTKVTKELVTGKDGALVDLDFHATEYAASVDPTDKFIGTVRVRLEDGFQGGEQQYSYFTKRWRMTNTYSNSDFYVVDKVVSVPPPFENATQPSEYDFANSVRCDNASYLQGNTPGCVNPDVLPNVEFPHASYPFIAPNIENGMAKLGGLGSNVLNPLHRLNGDAAGENRDASCSAANKAALTDPPTNMVSPSCDEYPFATSVEGGGQSSIAWVPLQENRSQGGRLSSFYNQNRVIAYPQAHDGYTVSTP